MAMNKKSVQIGALWVHEAGKEDVLLGNIEFRLLIVRNRLKRSAKSPDYLVYMRDQGYFLPTKLKKKGEKREKRNQAELRSELSGRNTDQPEQYSPETGTAEPKSFL